MGTLFIFMASALWGFIHSFTASQKLKDAARKALGTPADNWYRLVYNGFSLISFLPILALTVILPDRTLYTIPEPWADITSILQLMSVIVLVIGVLQTDVLSFVGLRQVMGGVPENKIVTGGLYKYVRHPLYTAGLVFIWLTPVMTLNRLALYLCLTVYIFIGVYYEERKLIREYGNAYQEYQAKTPKLIPFRIRHN